MSIVNNRLMIMLLLAAIGGQAPIVQQASADDPSQPREAAHLDRSVATDSDVQWSVQLDKTTSQIAEPMELLLTLDAPLGTRVRMPVFSQKIGDFEVHSIQEVNDLPLDEESGQRRWLRRVTLETIRTGDLQIPPLSVLYRRAADSDFHELYSAALDVHVTSLLEDRADITQFRDIKGVVDVAIPQQRRSSWIGWIGAATGTVAAFALLVFMGSRRRKQLSPAEWALDQIAELELHNVLDAAGPAAMVAEVADIVREFTKWQFGLSDRRGLLRDPLARSANTDDYSAQSQTRDDFLASAAHETGLGEQAQQHLAAFLAVADDVKFARRQLTHQEAHETTQRARQFIVECGRDCPATATEVN
jgi:hypothetical protein